jgi:hypothetical protein
MCVPACTEPYRVCVFSPASHPLSARKQHVHTVPGYRGDPLLSAKLLGSPSDSDLVWGPQPLILSTLMLYASPAPPAPWNCLSNTGSVMAPMVPRSELTSH